jgi:hypothetical protein
VVAAPKKALLKAATFFLNQQRKGSKPEGPSSDLGLSWLYQVHPVSLCKKEVLRWLC